MRRSIVPALIALFLLAGAARASAQGVPSEQLTTYSKAYVAIGLLRDQFEAEFAQQKNKKPEAQQQLHESYRQQIVKIITDNGLTEEQYNRITFVISTQPDQRKAFEKVMGIPEAAPPPPPASATMSANPHVGHIMNSFNGTPNAQGLLATAVAEAQVVVQHAGLAAKSTGDLDGMKKHAMHIMHAIDPAEASSGPGTGYGLRKAAAGVATHIELAAKADALGPVATHSVHIGASAKNTVTRAEQILALAKQIQEAGSAKDAAALVAKLNTVAAQLMPGFDANGDGKISWEDGEGGLDQVDQHLKLMTAPPK